MNIENIHAHTWKYIKFLYILYNLKLYKNRENLCKTFYGENRSIYNNIEWSTITITELNVLLKSDIYCYILKGGAYLVVLTACSWF